MAPSLTASTALSMVAKPGHQHHTAARGDVAHVPQHVEPGDTRHAQVEQDEVGRPLPQLLHGVAAIHGGGHVESLGEGDGTDQRENGAVVVDDQQTGTGSVH